MGAVRYAGRGMWVARDRDGQPQRAWARVFMGSAVCRLRETCVAHGLQKTEFPIFDVLGSLMTARHPATICEWFRGDMGVHWKDVLGEQRKPKGWRYVSRRLSRVR